MVTTMTADAAPVRELIPSRKDIGPELGLLVSNINGLANLLLLLGKNDSWLLDSRLGFAGLFGAGLGGVGLVGVIARPLVLLPRLGLEEIERLVHPPERL